MSLPYDRDTLRAYVGDRVFARGLAYFDSGAVSEWDTVPGGWRGTVTGTSLYDVELKAKPRQPEGLCDCPAAEDDSFCKHLVALALQVMAGDSDAADLERVAIPGAKRPVVRKSGKPAAKSTTKSAIGKQKPVKATVGESTAAKRAPESDEDLVRRWLGGLPVAALIDRTLHYAGQDRDLWRSLTAEAHAALAPPEARRETIKRLIGNPRFMDYRRTLRYADSLEPMFGMFAEAIRQDPVQAIDLVLYALQRALSVYANSDDSSGALGDVVSRIGKCFAKTAKAHRQANPAIVKPLFLVLERDDWRIVGDLRELAPALDDAGLSELQRMAQRQLDASPVKEKAFGTRDYARWGRQHLLENIMKARGDIDSILALRAANLFSGYDYLQLAELCESHRRHRQAIEWLERGIKAFPDETRLHEELAAQYQREGFTEDALAIRRQAFERQPTEEHFLALRKSVSKKSDWPPLREALYVALEKSAHSSHVPAADIKVRLMLLDGEADRAHALALKEGVLVQTWPKVFQAIEKSAPAAAASIAKRLIERAFENAYMTKYEEPVAWVQKMKTLAARDRAAAALYREVLTGLRVKHARKTKLMKLLDAL